MDAAALAPGRRTVSGTALAVAAASGLALLVAGRALDVGGAPVAHTFALIFVSIVVEALPFVLLGALVSALLEVFVPAAALERVAGLPLPLQLPAAAVAGLGFPVCECGSVPVARRLIARGVHPAAGVAFMLAAPILNPVVLASTAIAYRGRGVALEMVLGRATIGLALAVFGGWALGTGRSSDLLRPRPEETLTEGSERRGRAFAFVEHMSSDFFFMGRFIVLGGALAAALQTLIPQSVVAGVATTPVIGSLALMGLAFVLSLCSEADAFVAVSFVQFPLGGQLAFLVFGPAVDAKLSFLYGATFRSGFVPRLVLVALPVVLAGSLWFEVLVA